MAFGVPSAALLLNDTATLPSCRRNRPLMVLTDATAARLTQATSGPTWLVLMDERRPPRDALRRLHVPLDCLLLAVQLSGRDAALWELYRVAESAELFQLLYDEWRPGRRLRGPAEGNLFTRRSNLHGLVLHAATIDEPPITILRLQDKPPRVDGFFGAVWRELETKMNFSTQWQVPADLAWGSLDAAGKWSGMMGLVVERRAQLAVAEFTMTVMRATVVDFSIPLIETSNSAFLRQPAARQMEWAVFAQPFSPLLWSAVLVVVLLLSAALHVGGASRSRSFSEVLLCIFGAVCMQGLETGSRRSSARLVVNTAYLVGITLLAAYSGMLVSILAERRADLPFQTLEELLKLGTFRLGVLANSGQLNEFNRATVPLLKDLYEKLIEPDKDNLPSNMTAGLVRVCAEPRYTFMTSLDVALGLMNDVPCPVVVLHQASIRETLAMVVAKRSPYRGVINHNLQALRYSGALQRLRGEAWPRRLPRAEVELETVALDNIKPVFALLVVASAAATLLLAAETLACKLRTGGAACCCSQPLKCYYYDTM